MRNVKLSIGRENDEKLKELAKSKRWSVSVLVSEIVKSYIQNYVYESWESNKYDY